MSKDTKKEVKDGRAEALEEALTQIQKQFGQGAIMKLGDLSLIHI